MNDFMKIIKSPENSVVLIAGVTKTVKHEIKKQEGEFSRSFVRTFGSLIGTTRKFFSGKRY